MECLLFSTNIQQECIDCLVCLIFKRCCSFVIRLLVRVGDTDYHNHEYQELLPTQQHYNDAEIEFGNDNDLSQIVPTQETNMSIIYTDEEENTPTTDGKHEMKLKIYFNSRMEWLCKIKLVHHIISRSESILRKVCSQKPVVLCVVSSEEVGQLGLFQGWFCCLWLFVFLFLVVRVMQQSVSMPLQFRCQL